MLDRWWRRNMVDLNLKKEYQWAKQPRKPNYIESNL